MAGLKKCVPMTSCGRRVERRDAIDVERRGVRRENCARLHRLVERTEHLLLDAEILEHGLDDDVRLRDFAVGKRWLQERHACAELVLRELAFLDLPRVHVADPRDPGVERGLLELEQLYRNAGVQEVDRDAGAHRACANHRRGLDLAQRCRFGNVVDPGRRAFRKEQVTQRARDVAVDQPAEQTALLGDARSERQRGRCDGIDARERRRIIRKLGLRGVARKRRDRFEIGLVNLAIANARRRQVTRLLARECLRRSEQIAVRETIDERRPGEQFRRQWRAGQDHVERAFDPEQTRQPLGAARARQQSQLDLGQAEPRVLVHDAIVTAERELETAAERNARDRGDDGFRRALERVDELRQRGRRERGRRVELADVRAGRERVRAPDQHQRLDVRVVIGLVEHGRELAPQCVAQCIDGRIAEVEYGNAGIDGIAHGGHAPLLA